MANKNVKELTVKIEGQEWQDALDKAFKNANKNAKIDGFRPGKAPKDMFIKKYGIESLFMDAGDLVIEKAFQTALKGNEDLELVAQPDVQLKGVDEKHIEFLFTLTMKPEVKLGDYKNLDVKKESVKVTEKDIDSTIDEIRHRYAESVVKEGAVEEGDTAVIDFEGFNQGVAFPGGKGENYDLKIGSHTFIPGFEEQLIGMTTGETRDIDVVFPEDYHEENLKGAPVVFKVTVNEIKTTELPEINEDLFKDLGMNDVKNEEELRAQVKETIKLRKETDAENKYIDALIDAALKTTKMETPEVMVHEEAHRMVHQYEEQLKMQGLTLEQFFQFTNSDEQALMDQMNPEAKKRVESRLMLEAIVKAEKLEVSDKEAEKEAEELSAKYQMKKDEFLNAFGGLDMIKYDLTMKAAIELLKGNK